ncbi:MAG: hypothetical protein CMA03_04355 [Euryarchaeota archaeon]|nr:hypothetical protein [Euryarchaeota archaeon]
MRKQTIFVIMIVFVHLFSPVHAVKKQTPEVSITLSKHDWLSNETIPIYVYASDLVLGDFISANWQLYDETGLELLNGTYEFEVTSEIKNFVIIVKNFYNNNRFYTFNLELIDSSSSIIGDAMEYFTVFRNSYFNQIPNLLVFGDSLSDMGNAKNSILNVPDVPPYWENRFSNGKVWIDYISQHYGVSTSIGSGTQPGDNRAFGGSQTGQGYSYLLLPNVGTQINNYLTDVQANIPSDNIVSLWAGGNDFLYGTADSDIIVTNMESHIRQLVGAGANELIIPNLPPLEKTPEGLSRTQNQQNELSSEIISYNSKLLDLINDLENEFGIKIHHVDAWTAFNDVVDNKESLGFTNVQEAACSDSSGIIISIFLPICDSSSTLVPNVDEYLFFDKAHPTKVMHKFISQYVIETIGIPDTDGDGIPDIDDYCIWTEDLATIDENGCSWSQRDDDNDTVKNDEDLCPNTNINSEVDENGCSAEQRDSDNDGLNDLIDPCPFSDNLFDHDSDGCSNNEDPDDDNDTILDVDDNCPLGFIGIHSNDLDNDGCHDDEDEDLDGDGVDDEIDPFPSNSSEWEDTDLDGIGDNSDKCPNEFGLDLSAGLGCPDLDNDGFTDSEDAFVNDSSEWNDTDGDGIGDNSDDCPFVFGTSEYPLGCLDFDGDGFSDLIDAFPNDPNEWLDSDNDTYGDNFDEFPNNPNEWLDSDNDTYGDNIDQFPNNSTEWNDTDGDGVGDNSDVFPNNPNEWSDTDGDGIGDNEEKSIESAIEQKAEENKKTNGSILGISIVFLLCLIIISLLKNKNISKGEDLVHDLKMKEERPDSDFIEIQVINQWTDETGHTWRKMSDGSTLWWSGTDWQKTN